MHEYVADHAEEVATWYLENLKPAGLSREDLTEVIGNLRSHIHPIGPTLVDQIRRTSEDLKLVKVLDPETDPKEFAERIVFNLLG